MTLADIYEGRGFGSYVVASVLNRNEEGYPDNLSFKQTCESYEEAVKARERLIGEDIIICPPFKSEAEVPPRETADYFRAYFGNFVGVQKPWIRWSIKL